MSDTASYAVQGMTCSSCATKVSNAVIQVPGVVDTDVDLATGRSFAIMLVHELRPHRVSL